MYLLGDGNDEASRPEPSAAAGPLRPLLDLCKDGAAALVLGTVLVITVGFNGGFGREGHLIPSFVALVVLPFVAGEVRTLPREARALIGVWGVGAVLSVAFAGYRAGAPVAILSYGLPPVVLLAAMRLRRSRRGSDLIVALLTSGFIAYWILGLLRWLEPPLSGFRSNFLPIAWHNASGMLMGGFGLIFLGLSVTHPQRSLRIPASLGASLAFAGLYVTGSRGSMMVTALGLVVLTVASRGHGVRRMGIRLGGVLLGSLVAVVMLLSISTGPAETGSMNPAVRNSRGPVSSIRIAGTAEANFIARLHHMGDALDMFRERPVTGGGLGSYEYLSRRHVDEGANFTMSAHNEFAEALGEGGLVFGVPFIVFGLASASIALRALRRNSPASEGVTGLTSGSAVVVLAVLLHTAVDTDWEYAVLPGLLVTALALAAPVDRWSRPGPLVYLWVLVPVAVVLLLGTVGAALELRAERSSVSRGIAEIVPWDHQARAGLASEQVALGHVDHAEEVLRPAVAWNPDTPDLDVLQAVIDHVRLEISSSQLVEELDGLRTGAHSYVWAARRLRDVGDDDLARSVIEQGFAVTRPHAGASHTLLDRRTARALLSLHELSIRLEADTGGCDSALRALRAAVSDPVLEPVEDARARLQLTYWSSCS